MRRKRKRLPRVPEFDARWERVFRHCPYLRSIKEETEKELGLRLDGCIRWDLWRFSKKADKPALISGRWPVASVYLEDNSGAYCIEFNPQILKADPIEIKASFLHEIGHIAAGHFLPEREAWVAKEEAKKYEQRKLEMEAECYIIKKLGLATWKFLVSGEEDRWVQAVERVYRRGCRST